LPGGSRTPDATRDATTMSPPPASVVSVMDSPMSNCGAGQLRPVRAAACHHAPPPPSRTNWTRLVPRPVLTGRVSSRQGEGVANKPGMVRARRRPSRAPALCARAFTPTRPPGRAAFEISTRVSWSLDHRKHRPVGEYSRVSGRKKSRRGGGAPSQASPQRAVRRRAARWPGTRRPARTRGGGHVTAVPPDPTRSGPIRRVATRSGPIRRVATVQHAPF
jgi:hypothetical protein